MIIQDTYWKIKFTEHPVKSDEFTASWVEKHTWKCSTKYNGIDSLLLSKLERCLYSNLYEMGYHFELCIFDISERNKEYLNEILNVIEDDIPYEFHFDTLCFYFMDLGKALQCISDIKSHIDENWLPF